MLALRCLLPATLAACSCLHTPAAAARALTLYVSPAGSDDWSGTLPVANEARTDGPLASILRARDVLRQMKAAGALPGGARVELAQGVYFLTETLTFGPEDSGAPGAQITYATAPGANASLRGSVPITGWEPREAGIYRARVPGEALQGGRFWQLSYRGKRQTLARYPNVDLEHPRTGGFLYAAGVVEEGSKTLLRYNPARLDASRWARPAEMRVHIWSWLNWNRSICPVKEVDAGENVISLAQPASYKLIEGNRFFVENAIEELDAPGEWYFDAASGYVYFIPPDGQDPADDVSLPVLTDLIRFQGNAEAGAFVSNIRIEHLDLRETRSGLVKFRMAQECTVAGCTLQNCGGTALSISNRSHHNKVLGCDIAHVGGSAITLDEVCDWEHGLENRVSYNLISNNHVHDVGEGADAWGAIRINPGCGGNVSHDNVISHNLVHDTPRQGISFNGFRNVVEYNHVHHTNQEQSDTGAIGMGSRDIHERGSIIRYNYIHDTGGYNMLKPGVWEYPHYCWGVYLDDYTSGVRVFDNLIVRAQRGGVMVHGGQDNVIEGNVIVDSDLQQVEYAPIDSLTSSRTPAHPDKSEWLMTGTRLLGNVFSYSKPEAGWLGGRKWEQVVAESDRNLIWHKGQPVTINLPGVEDGDYLGAWRKLGFDKTSVVADPLFLDTEHDDYRLRPESPAFALGFRELPIAQMGLYQSPDRASWPVDDDPWREEHLRYPEGEPAPPKPRTEADIPRLTAARCARVPVIDGRTEPPEWDWGTAVAVEALSLETGKGKRPSRAVGCHDDDALYIALENEVSNSAALLKEGGTWGADDGAEVCVQVVAGTRAGPVYVVQGYPSGKWQSVTDAGASPEAAGRLGQAATFAATIGEGKWTGEWRLPFAALGIDPGRGDTVLFNIGVLKAAEKQWIAWVSTGGAPWHMDRAGKLLLGE